MGLFNRLFSRRSAHDGGSHGRDNQNWTPVNGTGEELNQFSRETVRARLRDLERNSDNVAAIVDTMERHVVGTGINLQAKILRPDGSDDETLNDRVEELWRWWSRPENCDVAGRMSLVEMQDMATRRRLVDGGLLFILCDEPGARIPFRLQLKEVDELDTSVTTWGKGNRQHKVVGGLELSGVGRIVAYHFKEYDLYGWTGRSRRVPAKHVIYLDYRTRPSEVREFSPLAKIMTRLRDLNEYVRAVSVKEKVLACLSVFISKVSGGRFIGNPRNAQTRDQSTGHPVKKLAPGMIEYLDAGDKVEVVNPSGQASNARDFVTMMQRQTGAAVGLSYEAHSRDMSQVNYSSARQGLIDDHATYKRWQTHLVTHFLVPVYEKFLEACVLAGLLTIPDFFQNRERYSRCTFIPNGMDWIDPLKEAQGNRVALETGQTNLEKIYAAKGEDYREALQQRAVELNYMRELGILPPEGVNANGK